MTSNNVNNISNDQSSKSYFRSCIEDINKDINDDPYVRQHPKLKVKLHANDYDMLIAMEFKPSDIFSLNPKYKKGNQTHIPITGQNMNFFPFLTNMRYLENNKKVKGNRAKKSFDKSLYTLTAPFRFYGNDVKHIIDTYDNDSKYVPINQKKNIVRLTNNKRAKTVEMKLHCEQKSYASIKLARRKTGDQIELGIRNEPGISSAEFIGLKQLIQSHDYLVILKSHKKFEYTFILLDKRDHYIPSQWKPESDKDSGGTFGPVINREIVNLNSYRTFETDIHPQSIGRIITDGTNRIYYGAPGTGKSYTVSKRYGNSNQFNVFRTTFYPDYDYNDFVGQVMPSVNYKDNSGDDDRKIKNDISYNFYPGPFTQALLSSIKNPNQKVSLIIEELSRANASAVFGDIFQLLDRDNYGVSKYPINNDYIANYIKNNISEDKAKDIVKDTEISHKLWCEINHNKIRIPGNMNIIATMNTSDQNVTPIDSAFKRRFNEMYVPITPPKDFKLDTHAQIVANTEINIAPDKPIKWVDFYQILDNYIANVLYPGEDSEDKQIGMFFMNFTKDKKNVNSQIRGKLLQYLWSDVNNTYLRKKDQLFNKNSFAEVYINYGKSQIFSKKFLNYINSLRGNNNDSNE